MSLAVLTDDAGSIDGENNRQVLYADIVDNLVECALQEGGVDSHNGDEALRGKAGGEGYCMLLADSDIEDSFGELLS